MMLKKSKSVSILMTESLIKLVLNNDAGMIEKILKQKIEGDPEVALQKILQGMNLKNLLVTCVIPGEYVTTKSLEIPAVDHEEIESILTLQATRHTPFHQEEILTSYAKLKSPKPSFSQVLLVVIKREIIKEKTALLKRVGLNIDRVVFAPEAVACFYAKAIADKKKLQSSILLDVDAQNSNVIVVDKGQIVFSRNIPVGMDHLIGSSEFSAQFISEVVASVDAYRQDDKNKVLTTCIITKEHDILRALSINLESSLGVKVETISYTSLLNNKTLQQMLHQDFIQESALDVVASASTARQCQISLIPQEIKEQRALAEKGKETFKAGILAFLLFLFIGGALFSKVYFRDLFLKNNLIAKYEHETKTVETLKKQITRSQIVQDFLESRALPLEAVAELYKVTPVEIYLTNIAIDDGLLVTIQGVSDSMSQVFTYVTALESSELFEGVKTKSTTSKKERGKDVAGFEISFKLIVKK